MVESIDKNQHIMGRALRIAIVIAALVITSIIGTIGGQAATITVCLSGCNYNSIQTAINAANNGDTINVTAGTYTENVDVTKSLNIIGADPNTTIVNASNPDDHVFDVSNVNNVKISGFTIRAARVIDRRGVRLKKSNYSLIENIKVSSTDTGIHLQSSNFNTISNVLAVDNAEGLAMYNSSNNTVSGNNVSFNGNGAIVRYSNNNIFTNNTILSNTWSGLEVVADNQNLIYNNFFNNAVNVYFSGAIYANTWNTTKIPSTNIIGGPYLGGNFWANPSGYGFSQTCADSNSDGICDSPYTLDTDNIDYLPLARNSGTPSPTATFTPTPTVTPTPSPSPTTGGDIISRYAGSDGIVQKSEAVQAVMDYFSGIITRQDAISVVMAYFNG